MKQLLIISLFFFNISINSYLFCQIKNDLVHTNLKGKVKSVTVTSSFQISSPYSNELSFFRKKGKVTSKIEFDDRGFIVNVINSDKRGSIIERFVYQYDHNGRKTKGFRYNKNDSVDYAYIF